MKEIGAKEYIEFIKEAIKENEWKVADKANKLALENKAINLDQYREAAQVIVAAYKKENW